MLRAMTAREGENYDVVPALMDVLADAMATKGREAKHIRYRYDRSEKQIDRYLKREAFPKGADLENFVAAVAVEVGSDRLTLWRRALDEATEATRKLGLDPRREAAEAVQVLPPS
jgi:hypothetical protein